MIGLHLIFSHHSATFILLQFLPMIYAIYKPFTNIMIFMNYYDFSKNHHELQRQRSTSTARFRLEDCLHLSEEEQWQQES